jgi:hypothetical protein
MGHHGPGGVYHRPDGGEHRHGRGGREDQGRIPYRGSRLFICMSIEATVAGLLISTGGAVLKVRRS